MSLRWAVLCSLLVDTACGPYREATPARSPRTPSTEPSSPAARAEQDLLLVQQLVGRFDPETASENGYEAFDAEIVDLGLDRSARWQQAAAQVEAKLAARSLAEPDPDVAIDVDVLLAFVRLRTRREALESELLVPVIDVGSRIHAGLSTLLDPNASAARKRRARDRLRRYVGAAGTPALVSLAERRTRRAFEHPELLAPSRASIEKLLRMTPILRDGLTHMLAGIAADDAQLVARLTEQLDGHVGFLRDFVLPRTRSEFRQPAALYELALQDAGIEMPPDELAARAHRELERAQREMQELATELARTHGLPKSDYRSVLRALKAAPVADLLGLYRRRNEEIEAILRREHLLSVPARRMTVRLASDAEAARLSAPFFMPPRLIGNTGELGELVLPRSETGAPNRRLDDFAHEGASWWLSAHEGRPGHDLQFSTLIERKVSLARSVFGFNSANAEGWGMYAEELVRPFMPKEAQLFCLQARAMRAAHAFLDIELNLGRTAPEQARRVLIDDVVFSEAWADQAVERYTLLWPGQAPSYLYGYLSLTQLHDEVRRGGRVTPAAFHDFVLAQGFLPQSLLRKTVLTHFAQPGTGTRT